MKISENNLYIKNVAILGKQPMNVNEAKLLRLAITSISQYDKELMEYTIKINDLAELLDVDSSNVYRDIYSICAKLSKRTLEIKDDHGKWDIYPWVSKASYDPNDNNVRILLNKEIKSFVIDLNTLFTKYKLINVLALKSFYAIRVYEILISSFNHQYCKKHSFEFSVADLRQTLIEPDEASKKPNPSKQKKAEKYKQIGQFRENVLDVAMNEINKKTDLNVSYKTKKTGRTITAIIFYVNEKPKLKSNKNWDINLSDNPNEIEDNCTSIICGRLDSMGISNTIDQCNQLAKAYNNNLERFEKNLSYVVTRMDINNFIAYLITIAKNDPLAQEVPQLD